MKTSIKWWELVTLHTKRRGDVYKVFPLIQVAVYFSMQDICFVTCKDTKSWPLLS